MKLKKVASSDKLQDLRASILGLIKHKAPELSAEEILAMLSYTVGQLVALQDQRKHTPETVMQLVNFNIEAGNRDAIAKLTNVPAAGNA